ncbi:TPR repeat protein [Beggiatoa sp. SS]|nr:TPR repeat protein [Beggiatoa sp. SS]
MKCELPNLLFAVKGALAEITDYAVGFVTNMNHFLNHFGLQRDLEQFNKQVAKLVDVGSRNWYLSQSGVGEQWFNTGNYSKAANIFTEILTSLGTIATYERCVILGRLGRCFESQEKMEQAAAYYQQGLETAQQLEQTQNVQRLTGLLYTDLGNALLHMGRYAEAQTAYEQCLAIATEQNDYRQKGVVNGQLGYLALLQDKLDDAKQCYQTTLTIFQSLHEPNSEANYWHQLGRVYQRAKQWESAEHAYRQAANIYEVQGNLPDVAKTWNNLAAVTQMMDKLTEAEAWYHKAIKVHKQFGNASNDLHNLANLLQNQPDRLTEAQQLAEQALTIKKTLDPATAEIWKTYELLGQIADKQGNVQEAKKYRRLAREAKANFAGTRYKLKKLAPLILMTVQAVENAEIRKELETLLGVFDEDLKNLKIAIQRILAGERDVDKLCEPLDFEKAPIITAILEGIERPSSLKWFEE